MIEKNKLRFQIGPCVQTDFKVFLGEEDISDRLMVKSFKTSLDANSGHTTVELEVYADKVEMLADVVNVHIMDWPRRTWRQRLVNVKDLFMLYVGDPIRRACRRIGR